MEMSDRSHVYLLNTIAGAGIRSPGRPLIHRVTEVSATYTRHGHGPAEGRIMGGLDLWPNLATAIFTSIAPRQRGLHRFEAPPAPTGQPGHACEMAD